MKGNSLFSWIIIKNIVICVSLVYSCRLAAGYRVATGSEGRIKTVAVLWVTWRISSRYIRKGVQQVPNYVKFHGTESSGGRVQQYPIQLPDYCLSRLINWTLLPLNFFLISVWNLYTLLCTSQTNVNKRFWPKDTSQTCNKLIHTKSLWFLPIKYP